MESVNRGCCEPLWIVSEKNSEIRIDTKLDLEGGIKIYLDMKIIHVDSSISVRDVGVFFKKRY